jgi:hypothetical protein
LQGILISQRKYLFDLLLETDKLGCKHASVHWAKTQDKLCGGMCQSWQVPISKNSGIIDLFTLGRIRLMQLVRWVNSWMVWAWDICGL